MEKTIFMPRLMGKQWLEALRSGKYEKGRHLLEVKKEDGTKSYCCLGVLQMVVDGKVERHIGVPDDRSLGVPSRNWLDDNRVSFLGSNIENCVIPAVLYHDNLVSVSVINDETDATFVEIADLLEQHMELT